MPLHQQTVRIDAIRRTGDERAHVFILLDAEMRRIIREDSKNILHFIRQRPVQHMQKKPVSDLHLFQVCQHLFSGEAGVTGQDGMRPFSAYGKGLSQQMPYAFLQRAAVRAVVDRQANIQLWDFQLSHNAAFVNSEDLVIFFLRCSQAS